MNNSKSELFNLLLKDNKDELKKFLLSNGKQPKPICPIRFIKNNKKEEELQNGK